MKPERSNLFFAPPRRWSSRDGLILLLIAAAGVILLFSGLSVRSLWGSEGRWAVVAKEMILSGNYFLPTINGEIYFDKPLMSYWMIIPFAWMGGMSETASRLPSACAGAGAALLLFSMGRRLFGARTGLITAGLLLTSTMFVLWARTASAELLNLLSVWIMLWAFMAGGVNGRLKPLLLLFSVGAVSAFLKGPVAPAVGFSAIGFYSVIRFVTSVRAGKISPGRVKEAFFSHFRWIASWQGGVSALAAVCVFAVLFLMPVFVTGSWQSAELMWRENVHRFFKPFDHVEPAYVYLKYIPLFFLPWTLLLCASLWQARRWAPHWTNRWTWLTGLAIFIFFTASGSRRSYYILPLVPALALITGRAISDWLAGPDLRGGRLMKAAMLATSSLPGLAGIALLSAYFMKDLPHHAPQLVIAVFAIVGSVAALTLFLKNKALHGSSLLFCLVFVIEIWAFTGGMATMEEMRTFRSFCREATIKLEGAGDRSIALFPGGDSSLVFYLNRGPLKTLKNADEAVTFSKEHPEGILISEMKSVADLRKKTGLEGAQVILAQKKEPRAKKDDQLVLLRLRPE
jgi:4-amino-4-deoxy-L-arabinose transferase-like glycosyltransferase